MVTTLLSPEELIALFAAKGAAVPPETSQALARHLQCKESIALAQVVTEAIDQYAARNGQSLPAPTEMLPPLA
ncbi:MAG: hypothetical protein ACYCSN_00320 [Acidobacteriaceae bacterium]